VPKFDHQQRLVELAAGVYVEDDTLRVVQAIREYDPHLRVKFLDPDRGGELGDPPYKIFELCPDGHERLVFGVWSLDDRVLERLYAADTQRHDILARLDRVNSKVRQDDARRFREEQLGEAREQLIAVLRTPKDTYRIPTPGGMAVFSATEPVKVVTKAGTVVPNDSQ